jgi:plasmid maintenance system antidote protein VapI
MNKAKIITPAEPTVLQKLFASPIEADEEAEFKGLMFMESLLTEMKEQGVSRGQLAERMGTPPSRITSMLNGSNNFTLQTLVRASRALGGSFEIAFVPPEMKGRWTLFREDEVNEAFRPKASPAKPSINFKLEDLASDDNADAA